jgi:hypothetical protein
MRRLALLLAASVLGTGCIVTDSTTGAGDIYLYWDFAKHAPAQTTTTTHTTDGFVWYDTNLQAGRFDRVCAESRVDTVRVIAANGAFQDYDCVIDNGATGVQGIWIQAAPSGTNRIRLVGYRGGVALYDSTFDINVASGQAVDFVADLAGVGAPLDLFGDLTFGNAQTPYVDCAEASSPQIGYEIWEPTFGLTVEQGRVSCVDPLPVPIFADVLDVDRSYGVRLIGYQGSSTTTILFDSCNKGFDHLGAQIGNGGVAVNLQANPIPTCQ